MKRPKLSAGIMTANWMSLGEDVRLLEDAGVEWMHIDFMDGRFCPDVTAAGPSVIRAIKTRMKKDVHLMVEEPLDYVHRFVDAGADNITIHVESTRQPLHVLHSLRGVKSRNTPHQDIVRGIAINPSTPINALEPLLGEVELILVLSINPGWGGQSFFNTTEHRVEQVRDLIRSSGRDILLSIDGGVNKRNIGDVVKLSPDFIISGSAIFDGTDAAANLHFMLEECSNNH